MEDKPDSELSNKSEIEENLSAKLNKEREALEIAKKAVVIRQKTRELEWFEMESKVRTLVYELIQPTAKKVNSNKLESGEIRKDMEEMNERIQQCEYSLKLKSK